ncbi:Ileal sodium/bile acid cotransporter [Taenia crassiceps]|uniref:Ileal sodium/bile acid cotransporter n=1 Tax=Taenia crassiceps TaxID=6207 RepID=A0ABR4Q394_9CEST
MVCPPTTTLFHLFALLPLGAIAFPTNVVTESLGGLIFDEVVLLDRRRIEAETQSQLNSLIITSNTTRLSIACPAENLTFFQHDTIPFNFTCNLTYHHIVSPLAISFETDIQDVASLSPPFWIYLTPQLDDQTVTVLPLVFSVRGHRMGSTFLKVWAREAKSGELSRSFHAFNRDNASQVEAYYSWLIDASTTNDTSTMGFRLKVLRPRGVLELAFRAVIIILVCGITFLMGCELDGRLIWQHMRRPVGAVIGFVCQFGLMPLIAFGVAMVVPIKPEFGFGLLTSGCCPGGGGSNIWTLLLHGDLNLSMTMTFISSIAALGMMPLMLFIFGRFFIDIHSLRIPYLLIVGQLCYIAVPVMLGMVVKWRLPRVGHLLVRLLRPLSFLFIATIIGFGVYTNLAIYRLIGIYPVIVPTATALPWIGFFLAGFLAFICRRSRSEILTISIETGIHNSGIAILVLIYSMPQPEGDIGAVMPIVVSIFTPLPLAAILIGQRIKAKKLSCPWRRRTKDGKIGVELVEGARKPLTTPEGTNNDDDNNNEEDIEEEPTEDRNASVISSNLGPPAIVFPTS